VSVCVCVCVPTGNSASSLRSPPKTYDSVKTCVQPSPNRARRERRTQLLRFHQRLLQQLAGVVCERDVHGLQHAAVTAADEQLELLTRGVRLQARQVPQHLGRHALRLQQQAHQHHLRPDVVVAQPLRLLCDRRCATRATGVASQCHPFFF